MPKLPMSTRYALDQILSFAGQVPNGTEEVPSHNMIRMIRNRLGMSQSQLAKRAGLPQSYIANIESGKTDLRASTIRKIFKALYCDVLIIPKPAESLDRILKRQVNSFVRRKISRVSVMPPANEKAGELIDQLITQEESKLLNDPGSEIWEE